MPRNRPTVSSGARALSEAAERLAEAAGITLEAALSMTEKGLVPPNLHRALAGLPPAPEPRRPMAEYRSVSELGPAHLGRWITVLGGTYAPPADRESLEDLLEAATYGAVRGHAIEQATGGRLVGYRPTTKPSLEKISHRILVVQQGTAIADLEVWGGRPAVVSPREFS